MNELMVKLQGERKYSFAILGVALVLTTIVGFLVLNKFGDTDSTISAPQGNLESEIEVSGPAVTAAPAPLDFDPASTTAAAQALDAVEIAGRAAAFGIATTTTAPPATTAPTTPPEPEPEAEPEFESESESESEPEPEAASKSEPEAPAPEPAAGEEGFVDTGNGVLVPPVLLKIRYCESRGSYTAKNPRSTAAGGYQFLTGSWKGYGHAATYGVSTADQATPAQQDRAALSTWRADGTRPWNASKSCWLNR